MSKEKVQCLFRKSGLIFTKKEEKGRGKTSFRCIQERQPSGDTHTELALNDEQLFANAFSLTHNDMT